MIAKVLFKTLKFSKLFNFFLAFVLISNQRSVAYLLVMRCCIKTFGVKILNNLSLWLPANKHFCEKRLLIAVSIKFL